MPASLCWVDKGYARVRGKARPTVGEGEPERRNRRAISDRFLRGRGTEEHAARRAAVRLGGHSLRRPRLPEHRRQGGCRGFDLRRPGSHRHRGHRLLPGTVAAASTWMDAYTSAPTNASTLVRSSAIPLKRHVDLAFCYLATTPYVDYSDLNRWFLLAYSTTLPV